MTLLKIYEREVRNLIEQRKIYQYYISDIDKKIQNYNLLIKLQKSATDNLPNGNRPRR